MAIELISKIKPKNNGTFSLIDAIDVEMPDGTRLDEAIETLVLTEGDNIKIENGVISVETTNEASEDNTKPITSAGVQVIVGNIDSLLKTI